MSAITVTAGNVRPLPGAVVQRYDAGGSISIGDAVYLASDGDVEKAIGTGAPMHIAIGVAASTPDGGTTVASGERVDVVVFGPVEGGASMTIGAQHFVSDTAGAWDTAVGTKDCRLGYAVTASILFVSPQIIDWS
jgi:hypothetical protein